MAEDSDNSEKTEQPTQKRLEEAAKRGQVVNSREINHFLILLMFAFTIAWFSPFIMKNVTSFLKPFIVHPEEFPMDIASVGRIMTGAFSNALLIVMIPASMVIVATFFGSFIQHGLMISSEPIKPTLSKISPIKGLKRMFSMRSLIEFLKGVLKIIIIGWVSWLSIGNEIMGFKELPEKSVEYMLVFLLSLATHLMIGICIAMFFIALFDYMYQLYEYRKSLRMSRQDLKDEYKQQEGDPIIKQRLRQLRMERARQRMMAAVPDSDVVITNPTHYSVALKYDGGNMRAPVVTAKGLDNIALKIREVAKENDIPLVENPPLARALYGSVEIDQEIPLEHYKAVAEVIGYVYRVKGKKM